MRKFVVFTLVAFVLTVAMAEAQLPQPITKRPVTHEEFIEAIRKDDQTILNTDCEKLVESTRRVFSGPDFQTLQTCGDLADWVGRMSVEECTPETEATFARIMPNGTHDLYGYSRNCRLGERWLFENQAGVYYASLLCGNIVTRNNLPVPYVAPVQVVATDPKPKEDIEGVIRDAVRQAMAERPPAPAQSSLVQQEDAWTPKPRHPLNWSRKSGKVFWLSAAAGVVVGVGLAVKHSTTTNTNTLNVYYPH